MPPRRRAAERQLELFDATDGRRAPTLRAFLKPKIRVDNFAGGGGVSHAIKQATGRSPDIALNHNAFALAVHAANHPETRHLCEDIYEVDPVEACNGHEVELAWFSPDCTHHSKAKGGKPVDQKIRGLPWSSVMWAHKVRPEHIGMENVEEITKWGPLHATHSGRCRGEHAKPCPTHRCHSAGCPAARRPRRGQKKARCRKDCRFGKPVAKKCHHRRPIKAREGETFRALVEKLERLGYTVRWWIVRACDYGAPTTRRRFILWASRDGIEPICAERTHGPGLIPYRTAAECIDWDIPCPSIFDRDEPLVEKTERRLARGLVQFVLDAAKPFLVSVNHGGKGRDDSAHRVHDVDAPITTITGGQRGGHAVAVPHLVTLRGTEDSHVASSAGSVEEPLRTIAAQGTHHYLAAPVAVPYLVHRGNGERPGQAPRTYDVRKPLGTIVAQGQKQALCAAFLEKAFSDRAGGWAGGQRVDKPISTVTTRDHHRLVEVTLSKEQLAGAQRVYAFLMKYYGAELGQAQGVDRPLDTITAKPRFGLVTVTIEGEEWVVVDIGMRMLTPRELYRCQGFPDDYVIDPIGPNGKPITKTDQIRMCGNSVPPQLAEAFIRANLNRPRPQRQPPPLEEWRAAA